MAESLCLNGVKEIKPKRPPHASIQFNLNRRGFIPFLYFDIGQHQSKLVVNNQFNKQML